MLSFLISVALAICGGWLGCKLKLPAKFLLGSMLAVGVFNIITDAAYQESWLRVVLQIAGGAAIGFQITKDKLRKLKHVFPLCMLVVVMMLLFGIAMGFILFYLLPGNPATAFFACAAAGTSDMVIISMDFGAETAVVAFLQLLRVVVAVGILPIVIKGLLSRRGQYASPYEGASIFVSDIEREHLDKNVWYRRFCVYLLVATMCGLVGYISGIKAGAIIFTMIGCSIYNLATEKGYWPQKAMPMIQMTSGMLIGGTITVETLVLLKSLLLPALVITVGYICLNLIAGLLLYHMSDLSLSTTLFATAPGGIMDMTIISADYGADMFMVAMFHTMRMFGVVLCYPFLIELCLKII